MAPFLFISGPSRSVPESAAMADLYDTYRSWVATGDPHDEGEFARLAMKEVIAPVCGRRTWSGIGDRESLAEEAAQETMIRVLQHGRKQDIKSDGELRAWLRTVARNTTTSYCRAEAARKNREAKREPPESQERPSADAVEELREAFRQLPEDQQEVVNCRREPMTWEETAEHMGLSVSEVKTLHRDAMEALRKRLE